MAMMASKGAVDVMLAFPAPAPAVLWSVKSVDEAEAPRRSPALRSEEDSPCVAVEDWICEAE